MESFLLEPGDAIMSQSLHLPTEILQQILHHVLETICTSQNDIRGFLDLRRISKFCDHTVFRVLAENNVLSQQRFNLDREIDRTFTLRYWLACIHPKRVPLDVLEDRLMTQLTRSHNSCHEAMFKADNANKSAEFYSSPTGLNHYKVALETQMDGTILRYLMLTTTNLLTSLVQQQPASKQERDFLENGYSAGNTLTGLWALRICEALLVLSGSRFESMLLLSRKWHRSYYMRQQRSRFFRRSVNYFALITFVREGNLEMTQAFLQLVKDDSGDEIRPGPYEYDEFVHCNNYHDEWYDALNACLFISAKQGNHTIFEYVLGIQSYTYTQRFCFIKYDRRTLLQVVASQCDAEAMRLLVDYGWDFGDEDTECETGDLGLSLLQALKMSISNSGRLQTIKILCDAGLYHKWQTRDVLQAILRLAANDNDLDIVEYVIDRLNLDPPLYGRKDPYSPRLMIDQKLRDRDPLESAIIQNNLQMLRVLLKHRESISNYVKYPHWYTCSFMDPANVVSKMIKQDRVMEGTQLEEMLHAVPNDPIIGRTFAENADRVNVQLFRVFAWNVNLASPAFPGSETISEPTVGQEALSRVLTQLQQEKARILIEEFDVRSVGSCVPTFSVSESGNNDMQAVKEIQSLLRRNGIRFRTTINYNMMLSPVDAIR